MLRAGGGLARRLIGLGVSGTAFWLAASFSSRAGETFSVDQLSGCWENGRQKTKAYLCFGKDGAGNFGFSAPLGGGFSEGWGFNTEYTLTEGRLKVSAQLGPSQPAGGEPSIRLLFLCTVGRSKAGDLVLADCERELPGWDGAWKKMKQ